jgi:holo-[acyl-carrier protein] synthase
LSGHRLSLRCGIDLIEIGRVRSAFEKRPHAFLRRFFTAEEQLTLQGRPYPAKHLAARVAAKEAVFKLLGAGIGKLSWKEVEIFTKASGEPQVVLSGRAEALAREAGLGLIALSLSHCREYAVAQAVAALREGGT